MKAKLQADGWAVLTGGASADGYWCQIRREGRVSHHESTSEEDAIAAAYAWTLALERGEG